MANPQVKMGKCVHCGALTNNIQFNLGVVCSHEHYDLARKYSKPAIEEQLKQLTGLRQWGPDDTLQYAPWYPVYATQKLAGTINGDWMWLNADDGYGNVIKGNWLAARDFVLEVF